jgi:hypothetical protein
MMIFHYHRGLATDILRRQARVAATWVASIAACLAAQPLPAQTPAVHYRYSGDASPGAIGIAQLQRGGPLPGYFQPVEIKAPQGVEISLAAQGQFLPPEPTPILAGMLIGPVYRLRVTRIPYHEGEEVFPSIEVMDRLYPPLGQERRFPIVVELTLEDLELALAGNFVIRVVYVEDAAHALPAGEPNGQIVHDARAGEDPLQTADVLGRPVAILRLGGRVPLDGADDDWQRASCSAPLLKLALPAYRQSDRVAAPQ